MTFTFATTVNVNRCINGKAYQRNMLCMLKQGQMIKRNSTQICPTSYGAKVDIIVYSFLIKIKGYSPGNIVIFVLK